MGLSTILLAGMNNPMAIMALFANAALYSILSAVISLLYFSYFESTSGQTPGKKLVNIKVVSEKGGKVTFGAALVRNILRIIDGIGFYLLGLIIIAVSDKKQRLGDMAAKTIVVKA